MKPPLYETVESSRIAIRYGKGAMFMLTSGDRRRRKAVEKVSLSYTLNLFYQDYVMNWLSRTQLKLSSSIEYTHLIENNTLTHTHIMCVRLLQMDDPTARSNTMGGCTTATQSER